MRDSVFSFSQGSQVSFISEIRMNWTMQNIYLQWFLPPVLGLLPVPVVYIWTQIEIFETFTLTNSISCNLFKSCFTAPTGQRRYCILSHFRIELSTQPATLPLGRVVGQAAGLLRPISASPLLLKSPQCSCASAG